MESDTTVALLEAPTMPAPIARIAGFVALVALGVLWLMAAPLTSAGDPCYHGFAMPPSTSGTETQIKVAPCAFAPTVTQVAVGSTVTFFNGPDFTHLVTGANQAWGSRDVELPPGATISYTFDKPGLYPYACALHRGMSGTIVVGDVATALAAGTTGSGTTTTGAGGASAAAGTTGTTGTGAGAVDAQVLVAVSVGAGAVVGALGVWFAMRRRGTPEADEAVAGVA